MKELGISSFALIDSLRIRFSPGFCALTGETGAGKSIILGALGFVLGDRASTDMIRAGDEVARVEALFDVSELPAVQAQLVDMGIPAEDNLVVSRQISRSGRGSCRINGSHATVGMLKRIRAGLIEVYEQHAYTEILDPPSQLLLLDLFGGRELQDCRREYERLSTQLAELQKQRQTLAREEAERLRRLDMLAFQVREIDSAELAGVDEDALAERRRILVNAEKLMSAVSGVYDRLYEGLPGCHAVLTALTQAAGELRHASAIDSSLEGLASLLESAAFQVEDVARDLRKYRERLVFDPQELSVIDSRLESIKGLKRKYGVTIADVLAYRAEAAAEMQKLEGLSARVAGLDEQEPGLRETLVATASRLLELRKVAARHMEDQIVRHLADIGMDGAMFQVDLSDVDSVEFLFSANTGEPLRRLAEIASGGEASRLMLAIKSALCGTGGVPTVVFDEIDSGIGGRAGLSVGKKIREVAKSHQVLCVTHLPQVAAFAANHYFVEKEERDGRTHITVRLLSEEDRPKEIARMLAGSDTGTASLAHAREILSTAKSA